MFCPQCVTTILFCHCVDTSTRRTGWPSSILPSLDRKIILFKPETMHVYLPQDKVVPGAQIAMSMDIALPPSPPPAHRPFQPSSERSVSIRYLVQCLVIGSKLSLQRGPPLAHFDRKSRSVLPPSEQPRTPSRIALILTFL